MFVKYNVCRHGKMGGKQGVCGSQRRKLSPDGESNQEQHIVLKHQLVMSYFLRLFSLDNLLPNRGTNSFSSFFSK